MTLANNSSISKKEIYDSKFIVILWLGIDNLTKEVTKEVSTYNKEVAIVVGTTSRINTNFGSTPKKYCPIL